MELVIIVIFINLMSILAALSGNHVISQIGRGALAMSIPLTVIMAGAWSLRGVPDEHR